MVAETDGEDEDRGSRRESAPADRAPARLEWLAAGLGALCVLGAITQLTYTALWRDQSPPDIVLTVERVVELDETFLVQFRARNQGGLAAAEVAIEGELVMADGVREASEASLDYLAPGSERSGGLIFTRDPRQGRLALRPTGYATP